VLAKLRIARRLPQFAAASKLRISPGSHSAMISKGRQHTSQSVVNRWNGTLVSITTSNLCPQNGHWMFPETSTRQSSPAPANRNHHARRQLQKNKRAGDVPVFSGWEKILAAPLRLPAHAPSLEVPRCRQYIGSRFGICQCRQFQGYWPLFFTGIL
jgi:hypothetical protein